MHTGPKGTMCPWTWSVLAKGCSGWRKVCVWRPVPAQKQVLGMALHTGHAGG